jgi:hypothetical protein
MTIGLIAQEIGSVGIGDGSLRFHTGTDDWEVMPWDGRFAVCRFSNERMRLTADGELLMGQQLRNPYTALACYWFHTREWAELAKRRLIAIDGIPRDIAYKSLKPVKWSFDASSNVGIGSSGRPNFAVSTYNASNWTCYLFGSEPGNGFAWNPPVGKVPNLFWRKMQFLMVGNKWVKQ